MKSGGWKGCVKWSDRLAKKSCNKYQFIIISSHYDLSIHYTKHLLWHVCNCSAKPPKTKQKNIKVPCDLYVSLNIEKNTFSCHHYCTGDNYCSLSISYWLPCAVWHIISLKKTPNNSVIKGVAPKLKGLQAHFFHCSVRPSY